jgi:hypothetical protein
MSLEFEQLTPSIAEMAREAGRRREKRDDELEKAAALLHEYADSWDLIDERLSWAVANADEKFYRSARPLHHELPLDQGIKPQAPPAQATIIATDGSQIVPDRHAPFLYYLINIGAIIYYHGSGRPPDVAAFPKLSFPGDADSEEDDVFNVSSNLVSMRRDEREISMLANLVKSIKGQPGPTLAILDQRLLYWPIGNNTGIDGQRIVYEWQKSMADINSAGGWLAGFIDRPGKRSVLAMLHTLDLQNSGRKLQDLYPFASDIYGGLSDTDLFDQLLQPEERSVIFIDISQHNKNFTNSDPDNEVCFFYLKTGPGEGQLARVDIPMWVARNKTALNTVHALLVDQCRIIGHYPYVITRADEIAVVGRRDQEELENRIQLQMNELGIYTSITSKQQSKEYARGQKTRLEGY